MKNTHTLTLAVGLMTSAISLTGCVETMSCTLIYAPSALEVRLSEPLTTRGIYTIKTTRDGTQETCELILVDSEDADDCVDDVCVTTLRGVTSDVCSWRPDMFEVLFDDDELVSLNLVDQRVMPSQLDIEIEHEGVSIGSSSFSPTYDVSEPNGAGCGTRSLAAVDLTVSNP